MFPWTLPQIAPSAGIVIQHVSSDENRVVYRKDVNGDEVYAYRLQLAGPHLMIGKAEMQDGGRYTPFIQPPQGNNQNVMVVVVHNDGKYRSLSRPNADVTKTIHCKKYNNYMMQS